MKSKAKLEPERRHRPSINSALWLGGPTWEGPASWPQGQSWCAARSRLHSPPVYRGNRQGWRPGEEVGNTSQASLSGLGRRSPKWKWPRGRGSACGRQARGNAQAMWGLREASPSYWMSAQHSTLSVPGRVGSVQRKAPVWGRTWRGGDSRTLGRRARGTPAQGQALRAAAARRGAPGPPSSTGCPALRREAGRAPPPQTSAQSPPGRGSTALRLPAREEPTQLCGHPKVCQSPPRCLT